ncbi:serine/threonine-protein phosphatase 2A activator isoform X1 [Harpegnathos saltator]|uniref:serine/threonine-protein phosphatase 2A activator isoform X1 n=1 Tax=Harpegnathos saltator TaxID=610380 RepID=UPI00058ECDDA|nr:serine/threonine-protein phosphatase 2A activator isoform X1 [Harpegnathos saltator]
MSTPKFPIKEIQLLPDQHEFVVPKKGIKVPMDIGVWQKSEAYFEYLGFILALNEAVQGKALDVECLESPLVSTVVQMLNKFDEWITEIPPTEQPQRFGNKSFRTWHERLQQNGAEELKQVLPEKLHRAVPEIVQYLYESFGNPTRIDYGTGHEMAFLMFLCCMFKIGAFKEEDKVAVVIKVFNRYLELARRLQLIYRMEPAGSHGVWSLDDYQFVPFIWGSAQLIGIDIYMYHYPFLYIYTHFIDIMILEFNICLIQNIHNTDILILSNVLGHPRIEPRHFIDQGIIQSYSKKYMFLGCIEFISKVKIGPFAEHSNQLWNVSAVSSWSKVNSGLIKMYKAEVLSKFPVIQHVFFGSLLPLTPMNAPPKHRGAHLNESPSSKVE